MANYVQLNQGLRNMADLTGRVLDYKTNNRQLDIYQQNSDRADREQEQRFHNERLTQARDMLMGMGNQVNVRQTQRKEGDPEYTLRSYLNENPQAVDDLARLAYDPRKLNESARNQGGSEFATTRIDEDGKVRFYMKTADGSLAPMADVRGQTMEFDPEEFVRAQESKALAFNYYDTFGNMMAVAPDQTPGYTGGGTAAAGGQAPAQAGQPPPDAQAAFAQQFLGHYGIPPSTVYGVAMEGDLANEAPILSRMLEANRQAGVAQPTATPPAASPAESAALAPADVPVVPEQPRGAVESGESPLRGAMDAVRGKFERDLQGVRTVASGVKPVEDYYPTLQKGMPDNAYDAGAATREVVSAPFKAVWDFLHPDPASGAPTLGSVGADIESFVRGVFDAKPPTVSEISKDPLPGALGKQVSTPADVISFVEASQLANRDIRPTQERAMVSGLARQAEAIEVDGTRFSNNSKEDRARRAAIWGHYTKLATGAVDERGVANLLAGDDPNGTAALEFAQQAETYRKFLDADIKMREQLSEEGRAELKFNREQNDARINDFAEMIYKRSSEGGEFGGRIRSDAEVREGLKNKFIMNHAFLTHIGAPQNLMDMDQVTMNQFLRGVEQALRLDGTQTGGWLFGVGGTTRDTRDQIGTDVMPPVVAATTWAALNSGNAAVQQRLNEFLQEHGEVEGMRQLGELLLKRAAGNGLVSGDE